MKKYIIALFFGLQVVGGLYAQTAVEAYGQLSVSNAKMVDETNTPVQLQGMSLFWSQWEGSYYRKEVVQQLRDDWCTNVVRAAMGVDESGGYLSYPAEKNKVKAVVDAAIELGMYVIIDWHSHHAEDYTEEAAAFFAEMAQTYGDYPNVLYEIYNEPLNVSWSGVVKPYCEEIIDTIRKYDEDNIIICGTPNWCQDVDAASNDPITGESNIMYTLHYYAATHGSWYRSKAETAIDNGIALFVTEFGTVEANGDGDVATSAANTWFEFLDRYDISYCNWSLCDKDEGASAITPGTFWNHDFESNLTSSGEFMYNRFTNNCPVYNVDGPPVITSEPENIIEQEGKDVTFSVSASGQGMSYQWKFNGEDIDDATENKLTLSSISNDDVGSYSVVITNEHGSVSSETVTLSLIPAGPYNGTPAIIPGIIEVEEYDVGARNVTHYDSDLDNAGGALRTDGVDISESDDYSEGNHTLGWTTAGEWLLYTVEVEETAVYDLEFRVAADDGFGGSLNLEFNEVDVTGTFEIASTGGWNDYVTVTLEGIALSAGEQKMRLNIIESAFNLNFINFKMQVGTNVDEDSDGVPATKDCDDNDSNVGDCTLAISDLITDDVKVYPNPFTQQFGIYAKEAFDVVIYDMTGSEVYVNSFEREAIIGDSLQEGVYIIDIVGKTFHSRVRLVKM